MKYNNNKYKAFEQINLPNRKWPNNTINRAPTWCSVDLRDGNQALVTPMNLKEKIEFFHALCDIGFKEIEIGFPSASEVEFEACRKLITENHIPDDVTIQVLVQAREHLIKKTFKAISGCKNVIIHFYNSTSTLQRKVVFKKDMDGIIDIAVTGAKLIKKLANELPKNTNIKFEYSPESFSGTETDNAIKICSKVMDILKPTNEHPIILNLPNTVEMCTPNTYADQIEYFIKNLPNRNNAIISVHPHNDRGTGIAATELALLAGAKRVEGTLFGNGERTGNTDIVTLALNMYTQGINPELNFSNLPQYKTLYERCTKMKIPERQPYAGKLVFTAFSGSHQDAINKGIEYKKEHHSELWEIPYLPIDPADIGRQYEPIIRINSQSGKGGAAFIMQQAFGYNLPKAMHTEFGSLVKAKCENLGRELSPNELLELFNKNYIDIPQTYKLLKYEILETPESGNCITFKGILLINNKQQEIYGTGNGPINAFCNALKKAEIAEFKFISYHEHAVSTGSDSNAIAYIELERPDKLHVFGVGIENNINLASIKGVLCAINRLLLY